jgi:hypothetical protein
VERLHLRMNVVLQDLTLRTCGGSRCLLCKRPLKY